MSRAWSATVAKEVLQNTPHQEIARQEAIHELIYTEEDYVRDLNLLDEVGISTPSRFYQPLIIEYCVVVRQIFTGSPMHRSRPAGCFLRQHLQQLPGTTLYTQGSLPRPSRSPITVPSQQCLWVCRSNRRHIPAPYPKIHPGVSNLWTPCHFIRICDQEGNGQQHPLPELCA